MAIGEDRPEVEATDIPLFGNKHYRSQFMQEWLNDQSSRLLSKIPLRSPRDTGDEVFVWPDPGHDPYNHYGRYVDEL